MQTFELLLGDPNAQTLFLSPLLLTYPSKDIPEGALLNRLGKTRLSLRPPSLKRRTSQELSVDFPDIGEGIEMPIAPSIPLSGIGSRLAVGENRYVII